MLCDGGRHVITFKAKFHYAILIADLVRGWSQTWSQTSCEPVCDQDSVMEFGFKRYDMACREVASTVA